MKKFVYNYNYFLISLFFSVILFFFIDQILYYYGSKIFEEKYSIINKIEKNKPDLLILGSSTSKYSLNPEFLDIKSFNSSSNGNGIIYSDFILSNFKEKNIKYILLGIDPANFTDKDYSENYDEMLLFNKYPNYFENLLLEINMFNFLTKNLKSFKIRSLPKMIKNYYSEINSNGFMPLFGDFVNNTQNFTQNNSYLCSDYSLNKFSSSALENIAMFANSNNIKVILTVVPLYAGVENSPGGMRSESPCFNSIMKFIDKTSTKNSFCNLTNNFPDSIYFLANNNKYFYDSAHLNNDGSIMYTKIMNQWINEECI